MNASRVIGRLGPKVIKKTAVRYNDRAVVIPTFAQMRNQKDDM